MSPTEYPESAAEDIVIHNDPTDTEKYSEKVPPEDDPFGNEETGEVKYRVMKWW